MSAVIQFFTLLSVLLGSFSVYAADVPDSRDLDILPRIARAEIVDYEQSANRERTYPQGAISRISGRLRMEGEVRSVGQLTTITYQLPAGHSSQEAFSEARSTLLQHNAMPLFWCEKRTCGSSSLYANTVFGNAKLYGPDDQQAYLLVRLAAPQENSLVAVYNITRGNRRAYLHVEQMDASEPLGQLLPSPSTLLRLLKANGELTLSHLPDVPEGAGLDLLLSTLRLDTGVRVELSGAAATAWRDALNRRGILNSRMELGQGDDPGLHLVWLR